jgi:hypothetical protein
MKFYAYMIILISLLVHSPHAVLSHPSFTNISIGQPDSPIPIISSKFYVGIQNSKDEEIAWTESDFVQLIPEKSCYRWEIELDTYLVSIPTKEVFILPEAPKVWSADEGVEGKQTLHHDNKISVVEEDIKVVNGMIESMWCVAEGDPTGNYKIEVYIKGVFVKSFNFTVGLKL